MVAFRTRALALALTWTAVVSAAPPVDPVLPRRAFLGVRFGPAPGGGFAVRDVGPGWTAAVLGVRAGDRVVAVDDRRVHSVRETLEAVEAAPAGRRITLTVLRAGKEVRLSGRGIARPSEAYPAADTAYGSVSFRGGRLRDITVTPRGPAAPPLVFLLQGYPCSTIEAQSGESLYAQLATGLSRAGIAFYRVEKPGVGDSEGGVRCGDTDFATELDAFRTAYRHLVAEHRVAPERIFLLGHSLGGMEAPLLAAELAPRGVAVFGTVLRDWADYAQDLARFQDFVMSGADPVAEADRNERDREIIDLFYRKRQPPGAIAAMSPRHAEALRASLSWDGGNKVYGRHFSYMQALPGLPLSRAWRDTRASVLSIYGASDAVALFDHDHRMIVDLVNHYRPGTARYVELPATSHLMDLVGDRESFRAANRAAGRMTVGPFNPAMTKILVEWIAELMRSPPVSSRAPD